MAGECLGSLKQGARSALTAVPQILDHLVSLSILWGLHNRVVGADLQAPFGCQTAHYRAVSKSLGPDLFHIGLKVPVNIAG